MGKMKRRTILTLAVLCLVTALVIPSAVGAAFPDRNIILVVTFSPGGGYDSIARAVARSMSQYLPKGVHVVVKNISVAGGVRGHVAVYRAKPDGYTIGHLQASGQLGLQVLKGPKAIGFDLTKYTWLARVGADPYGLFVATKGKYNTFEKLQKAKKVLWGVPGIGVSRWYASFLTAQALGIDFDVVAGYRGTGESLPGMIRGDFDAWSNPIDHPSTVPYLDGDIKAIVQLDKKRAVNAPDVKTAEERGYNFNLAELRAIGGPPGIPADRAKILEGLLLKAMSDKLFKEFKDKSKTVLVAGPANTVIEDLGYYDKLYQTHREAMLKAIARQQQ